MEFCSIFNVIKRTAFASFNIHKLYLDIWESIRRYSKLGSKNACQSHFCIAPCRKSHFTVSQMTFHAHRFPSIWPLDCFNRSSLQYWCVTTIQSTLPTLLVCLFFWCKSYTCLSLVLGIASGKPQSQNQATSHPHMLLFQSMVANSTEFYPCNTWPMHWIHGTFGVWQMLIGWALCYISR